MNRPRPTDVPYRHQMVRDLAFLLCAPAPWLTQHEAPRARLLGDEGPAHLAMLDAHPGPLVDWMAGRRPTRLGHYAEHLLTFWFDLAPHIERVATNLVLQEGRRTVGEFDFLLRIDGEPWHIETASKFYLQVGQGLDTLVGPSLRDAWLLKARKLERQLALSCHPHAPSVLPAGFIGCRCAALVAGWFFYRDPPAFPPPLAMDQCCGWIAGLNDAWPRSAAPSRWLWLPRLRWLSPARAEEHEIQDAAVLRLRLQDAEAPQLVAEMICQDGEWREVARGFVVPPGWPDVVRLMHLLERL